MDTEVDAMICAEWWSFDFHHLIAARLNLLAINTNLSMEVTPFKVNGLEEVTLADRKPGGITWIPASDCSWH